MADKSLGLGKLLSKSKSTIRRARKGGSVDGSNSIESEDAATSRSSYQDLSRPRSRSSQHSLEFEAGPGTDTAGVVVRLPALGEKEDEESTTPSLVSSNYESEDAEV